LGLVNLFNNDCHYQLKKFSKEQWSELSIELLSSFENEFNMVLKNTGVVFPDEDEIQPGLILSFQGALKNNISLPLVVEGVIGLQSDPDETKVITTLFLFNGEDRMRSIGNDYYEFELRKTGRNTVEWYRHGWKKDVYDEFEGIKKLGDLSR